MRWRSASRRRLATRSRAMSSICWLSMSLVPSRDPAVALRRREHVRSERMQGPEPLSSETALLAALRCGDEDAFSALVDAYGAAMHRVALTFVRSSAVADEVVQEAWLGALRGLDRFEGRSALRTWLLRIVANIARTHAVREARAVPFSSLELAREAAGARAGPPHRPLPRPRRAASKPLGLVPDALVDRAGQRSPLRRDPQADRRHDRGPPRRPADRDHAARRRRLGLRRGV